MSRIRSITTPIYITRAPSTAHSISEPTSAQTSHRLCLRQPQASRPYRISLLRHSFSLATAFPSTSAAAVLPSIIVLPGSVFDVTTSLLSFGTILLSREKPLRRVALFFRQFSEERYPELRRLHIIYQCMPEWVKLFSESRQNTLFQGRIY